MAATDPGGLVVTPEQVVAHERPLRTRAGFAALAAAVLTIAANLVQNATLSDRPRSTRSTRCATRPARASAARAWAPIRSSTCTITRPAC